MRQFIDVTGKTKDEAISRALEQLKLDRDDVSVEILERAKAGFLGLGSCPAKVRVSYGEEDEPTVPEQPKIVEKPRVEKPRADKPRPEKKPVEKPQRREEPVKKDAPFQNTEPQAVKTPAELAKREQSLERLANKVAAKVIKYRRSVTLEPMNAYERHVIHTALQEVPGVTTYSTGVDPNRRVIVAFDREKK